MPVAKIHVLEGHYAEARLDAAWREFYATVDALQAELRAAPPPARRKALAAVACALQVKGLKRLRLVRVILRELRKPPPGTRAA